MDTVNFEHIFNIFFGVIAMTLLIVGTLGNLFCLIILLRQRLRILPTCVFFAFMVFFDIIMLYGWNLNNFLKACFGKVLEDIFGKPLCATVIFYQCVSSQASAWILVAMSVERYLSVRIRVWRKLHFNARRAASVCLAIFAALFALNIHLVFTIQFDVADNETVSSKCFAQPMRAAWREIHFYIYSMVPFIVLSVSNSMLLYETLRKRSFNRTDVNQAKRKSMSLSVVFLTVLFIISTAPASFAGKFLNYFLDGQWSMNVLYFFNTMDYSYHTLNFLVFIYFNKQFSNEVTEIFKSIKQFLIAVRRYSTTSSGSNIREIFVLSFQNK